MTKIVQHEKSQKLKELYSESQHIKILLDYFASRGNNQRLTKVDSLLARIKHPRVPRAAAVRLFKRLSELELGTYTEGRHGHPSRFEWSTRCIDVGKASQGMPLHIGPISNDDPINDEDEDDESSETALVDHPFTLRSGLVVTIKLPEDLNEKEAERLANFIRTLPL